MKIIKIKEIGYCEICQLRRSELLITKITLLDRKNILCCRECSKAIILL